MSSKQENEAIRQRLKALFDVIYAEAMQNPDFLAQLETILLSPEAKLSLQAKNSEAKHPTINMLEILHSDGTEALRSILGNYTNADLAKLCVQEGIRKMKEAKSLDRNVLIELLLETATSRLKQGEAFVKRG